MNRTSFYHVYGLLTMLMFNFILCVIVGHTGSVTPDSKPILLAGMSPETKVIPTDSAVRNATVGLAQDITDSRDEHNLHYNNTQLSSLTDEDLFRTSKNATETASASHKPMMPAIGFPVRAIDTNCDNCTGKCVLRWEVPVFECLKVADSPCPTDFCGAHGKCISDGNGHISCNCFANYTGPLCVDFCDRDCGENGRCAIHNNTMVCVCKWNYNGADCSELVTTETPPRLTGHCMYKEIKYIEGETWTDGCTMRCDCPYDKLGKPLCRDRCSSSIHIKCLNVTASTDAECCVVSVCDQTYKSMSTWVLGLISGFVLTTSIGFAYFVFHRKKPILKTSNKTDIYQTGEKNV